MKLILIIFSIALVVMLISAMTRSKYTRQTTNFIPDPRNDKSIVVKGWNEAELKRIISDFEKLYQGRLGQAFSVVYQPKTTFVRLTFPNDIPALIFGFLVNYIYYPEAFDFNRSIIAVGEVTLSQDFAAPDARLSGKKAQFYVPSNDQEHDLVYVRIGSETFENSFASTKWKRVSDPRLPPGFSSI